MQTIVDTLLHDGDSVTVLSSGPSFIEVGPTYDRKMVSEAANKVRGSGYPPTEIFKLMENSRGPGDIRDRAQMAFYAMYGILGELESSIDGTVRGPLSVPVGSPVSAGRDRWAHDIDILEGQQIDWGW